ncbi:MAG: Ig-like domain-containing protein, partial [Limisphaerales bacterium]
MNASNVSRVINIPLVELIDYLTPRTAIDTNPPAVVVHSPTNTQTVLANRTNLITWTATDSSGIASVSIYLSLDHGTTYSPVVLNLPNSGSYAWVPPNRPTLAAKIKVVAVDNAYNSGFGLSPGMFVVASPPGGKLPTTLRDFDLPGSQPFEAGAAFESPANCASCHGNYNREVEPYFNWQGSMMAHSSRDPLFHAAMVIANQDAPDSGDLCIRCHSSRGWLQGRSVPTDGSRLSHSDMMGVSCAQCHQMVDPVFKQGISPAFDEGILNALSFRGTNYGTGMAVIDPTGTRRGPFGDGNSPHTVIASPFHREAAFCGTCHDVSNPAFERDPTGKYVPNPFNQSATNFSAHSMLPIERTFSEWLYSAYNSAEGVYAPQFAGNKP